MFRLFLMFVLICVSQGCEREPVVIEREVIKEVEVPVEVVKEVNIPGDCIQSASVIAFPGESIEYTDREGNITTLRIDDPLAAVQNDPLFVLESLDKVEEGVVYSYIHLSMGIVLIAILEDMDTIMTAVNECVTPEGVGTGDSTDKMIEVYGEPDEIDNDTALYHDLGLMFAPYEDGETIFGVGVFRYK